MYGITKEDIQVIDIKLEEQRKYITSRFLILEMNQNQL